MAYGFQQLDAAGNVLVDSSKSTKLVHKLWDQVTITLDPPNISGGTSVSYHALPGVTSQADFEDNYIVVRTNSGNSWWAAWFSDISQDHVFAFSTPGNISVTWDSDCLNTSGQAITCNSSHSQTQTFNIFSIGKTL